jgi:ribose-phosphate pyrophosphokinase
MIKIGKQEVKFERFPNGETRLVVDSINLKDLYVFPFAKVEFKFEDDSDLIKLMFVKNYLDGIGIEDVELLIYYMPYSRMDRSEDGSPFTLKYVSNFINSLNFKHIEVIEPHSDVTPALLNNVNPKFINFNLLPLVMDEIRFDIEKDYVVFPDLGASRRYKNMKINNVLIGNKNRDFGTGDIKSLDLLGDTDNGRKTYGRTAIIVDDLSSYGGTFIQMADRLYQEGFSNVYLLVAHAENVIFKRNERTGKLLFEHVEKVFTTDSLLTHQNNWETQVFRPQLKVYAIEDLIEENVL